MNLAKYLPVTVSLLPLLGLLITAEGCGGNVSCSSCDCDPDACSTGTTTETGTETGTGTGTTIPTSPGDVCDIICDCFGGCAGEGIESCLASFDEGLQIATEAGCEQEYLAMYACYEENLQCIDGELEYSACLPLIEAADACIEGPTPTSSLCDEHMAQVLDKYSSCGLDVEEPSPINCTDEALAQVSCFAACILEAPCSVFDDTATQAEMEAYTGCVGACP